jgi:NAD(P)-dependent dehydrogenase (short-subunit alcohol dehydrogenase family)/acyl carrier protein
LPAVDGSIVHLWALDSRLTEADSLERLRAAQRRVTGSVLHLSQALARASATSPRLWLVTRGAQPAGGEAAVEPIQASVWGLSHTLALEHPELRCVRLDLDPDDAEGEVERVMSELRAAGVEDQIALRGRLTRAAWGAEAGEPLRFRADASYLITGGLGGIGLEVAKWMAERGAGHLVLMGRRGPSEAAKAVLRRLEQGGTRIRVVQGDVADRDGLREILDCIASELPPLRGVMHAAGVLDDGVLLHQTWRRFETVMAPKVIGSWHLHTLTRDLPLDFFVLFSSGVGLLGAAGQGNHAAANAFMDALAYRRQGLGLPALTVNWGAWSDVGAAAGRSFGAQQLGRVAFTPEEGLRALERAMQSAGRPGQRRQVQVAVLAADWQRLSNRVAGHGSSPLLSELRRESAELAPPTASVPAERPLREQLATVLPNKRKALLQEHITRLAASVLGLQDSARIDVAQPLQELGLDSLLAVDLRNRLGHAVEGTLPATLLFEYPTVSALTGYLASEVLALQGNGSESGSAEASADGRALPEERIATRLLETLNRLEAAGPPRANASP